MIIETTISGQEAIVDDNSLMAIIKHEDKTEAFMYGVSNPIVIDMAFALMKEKFTEAKKRDRFSDQPQRKSEVKSFPVIEVGVHKFSLQTWRTEFEDGWGQQLKIHANFPVKNYAIKTMIEYVNGVEKYNEYGWSKYDGSISVGNLFDLDTVKEAVEQKIRECLED